MAINDLNMRNRGSECEGVCVDRFAGRGSPPIGLTWVSGTKARGDMVKKFGQLVEKLGDSFNIYFPGGRCYLDMEKDETQDGIVMGALGVGSVKRRSQSRVMTKDGTQCATKPQRKRLHSSLGMEENTGIAKKRPRSALEMEEDSVLPRKRLRSKLPFDHIPSQLHGPGTRPSRLGPQRCWITDENIFRLEKP
ncbi:hypothetical protein MMC08_007255 [Hypocenomyce scalaris]|nr:hypothetical protein [Hypocenomyce scalaris]